ncbi:MAG TPA: SprT-like domain-containing protein [Chryseosolibacter sp.]
MPAILSYHKKVSDYFRAQTKTWDFFAAAKTKEDQLKQYKTELLKNTYKFDPSVDVGLYKKVAVAREKLGLQHLEVTLHQAQYTDELNASIIYLEKEAHIVFSGQLIQLLSDEEMQGVIAHELAHIKLYTLQQGELEVTDRIITAIANNHGSEAAYFETARIFRLYTEIFCDRGAYTVLGSTGPVITSLVKVATGLQHVNAESYLKQADEIFSSDRDVKTSGISHPENFIRARAIQLWLEKQEDAEKEITRMIEGVADLDQLDIFMQREVAELTKKFLQLYLKPKWFQSTLVISHAKQYFPDFSWDENAVITNEFREKIENSHPSIKDYLSYVLLDFALLDRGLEDVPTGWAFQIAEDLELKPAFNSIVKKELKFSDKKLQQHKQKTLSAYYGVKEGEGEQIYEG